MQHFFSFERKKSNSRHMSQMHHPDCHSTSATHLTRSSSQLQGGRGESAPACPGSLQGRFGSLQPRACCLCSLPMTRVGDPLPSFCNRGLLPFWAQLCSNLPATLVCPLVAVIQVRHTGSSCTVERLASAPPPQLGIYLVVACSTYERKSVSQHITL